MRLNSFFKASALVFLAAAIPQTVLAHAFGQTYTLPVPLWLFLWSAAAAVIVSFLIFGIFVNKKAAQSKPLLTSRVINSGWLAPARIISVALFILTITAGYIGSQEPYLNFNVPFFWLIFMLGLTYSIAIFGDFWPFINPIKNIIEWIEGLTKTKFTGVESYPGKLGYYPALLFFFFIIWLELLSDGIGIVPRNLSFILITYVNLNILFAYWYGKEAWFKYGEFFSVFFRMLGKVAPVEFSNRRINLRWPFSGLIKGKADHFSLLLFILFMLSSTGFDGFRETAIWGEFVTNLSKWLNPQLINAICLILSPFILLAIYLVFIWLMKLMAGSNKKVGDLALVFSFSLIPIAVFYNVAHYFPMLLIQGQTMISLVSDPLGLGWNLFGTADYQLDIRIIDAATVWYSQIALIIIGHIAAVYVAHMEALQVFSKNTLLSQLPILGLMVFYTVISLWIIAQPIAVEAAKESSKNAEFSQNLEGLRQPPPPERPGVQP